MSILGDRLRQRREVRHEGLRDVADATGTKHPALVSWEQGRTVPRADVLAKLAAHFGESVEWLLGEPETVFGLPVVDDWPEGLREFIASDLAVEVELRTWEIPMLCYWRILPGFPTTPLRWATQLTNIRRAKKHIGRMRPEEEPPVLPPPPERR